VDGVNCNREAGGPQAPDAFDSKVFGVLCQ